MKRLLSLLIRQAKTADANVPEISVNGVRFTFDVTTIIRADEIDRAATQKAPTERAPRQTDREYTTYDEFAVIEYEDASGNMTRRRITINQTYEENGLTYLQAHCHERDAIRSFRADRVRNFITADGEVIDGPTFLRDQFGIITSAGQTAADRQAILLRRLKSQLRDPLTILIGLAKSDGHIHVEELDSIQIFAESEIIARNGSKIFEDIPMIGTLDGLCNSIGLMRPRAPTIATAASRLGDMTPETMNRFMKAISKVITADGRIAHEEIDYIEEIRWLCTAETGERMAAISDAMSVAV
jgi:hypothetical protein